MGANKISNRADTFLVASKGADNERRVILDQFWQREAETLAMARAAKDLLRSGLCSRTRDALRLSMAMHPARAGAAPDVTPTSSA